jgi:hypothetical protein
VKHSVEKDRKRNNKKELRSSRAAEWVFLEKLFFNIENLCIFESWW